MMWNLFETRSLGDTFMSLKLHIHVYQLNWVVNQIADLIVLTNSCAFECDESWWCSASCLPALFFRFPLPRSTISRLGEIRSASPFLWFPLAVGWLKWNFYVGVHGSFSVAVGVIRNASENIIMAVTHKLPSTDALTGEVFVTLLTSRKAASLTNDNNYIENDALLVVLAINNPSIFFSWCLANCTLTLVLFYHMLQNYLDVQLSLQFPFYFWNHYCRVPFGSEKTLPFNLLLYSIS